MKLIYNPKRNFKLVEFAARTCWQSHDDQKTPSNQFVTNVVNAGHESVIEHATVVIQLKKSDYDAKDILTAMSNTGDNQNASTVVASLVETATNWYLGINVRSVKNIIRNTMDNVTKVVKDITTNVIPLIPSAMFADFIKDGVIKPYNNFHGVEEQYPIFNSNDKYGAVTNLMELEEEITNLLKMYPDLTVNMITKLIPITFRWMAPMPINEQLLRHKGPVSKQSLRYTNGSNLKYHVPAKLKDAEFRVARHMMDKNCSKSNTEVLTFNFHDWMEIAGVVYEQGHKTYGAKQEDCRFMIPMAVETEVVFTKTLAQWGNVFSLRIEKHAQLHNRVLMSWVCMLITDYNYPILASIFKKHKDNINVEEMYRV